MDMFRFVKLAVGREYVPVSPDKVRMWIAAQLPSLKEDQRNAFEEVLGGRMIASIAGRNGVTESTIWRRVGQAVSTLRAILLVQKGTRGLFPIDVVSVYAHKFSKEVDWIELSTCLYGKQSRSLFWLVKQVEKGAVNLPMPAMVDGKYVWMREQAQVWRRYYVEKGGRRE